MLFHSSSGRSFISTILCCGGESKSHGAGDGCPRSSLSIASITPSSHVPQISRGDSLRPCLDLWRRTFRSVSKAEAKEDVVIPGCGLWRSSSIRGAYLRALCDISDIVTGSRVRRLTLPLHVCSGMELGSLRGLGVFPRGLEADGLRLDMETVWWIAVADQGWWMRMRCGIMLDILLGVKIFQVLCRDHYA
jgi:hypothetical protein